MNPRWLGLCFASGICFAVALFAAAAGTVLVALPFAVAGGWYGRKALEEDTR